ncbi:hypothetical protein B0I35DRAFT_350735 [Stachybotrys elegans]|uniref:Uncharacterized protein n=1 Tax=Stachybotrys elegans TaxID=80388 RepID=A0A8K0SZK5_9HYPO|nr:hypothetical protein B0I35DRAFT_350735 [Stachybotrys elegans]
MAAQIIQAPSKPEFTGNLSLFLAGTTSPTGERDWRERLSEGLSKYPITILNPARSDWDSTWKEDFTDTRWAEQVQWELTMRDKADMVIVFLHGNTLAPISLLELGLCAPSGKAIVCALDDYKKRGNVEAVCRMYGLPLVRSEEEMLDVTSQKIEQELRRGLEP